MMTMMTDHRIDCSPSAEIVLCVSCGIVCDVRVGVQCIGLPTALAGPALISPSSRMWMRSARRRRNGVGVGIDTRARRFYRHRHRVSQSVSGGKRSRQDRKSVGICSSLIDPSY
jgi:hypothetical protein